ncbi:hypothetical protein Goari_024510 [Gossypium aridum]|uniref:Uncharacterized protein n=1 Tax=Gossypium aridum TaxID=34290 RepID=A0A7J8X6V1_GOSAI|nr:hypothetical protein [Gossypium aridum]
MTIQIPKCVNKNLFNPGYFAGECNGLDVLFGILCWNLWKRRNGFIFDSNFIEHETVLEKSLQLQQQCSRAMENAENSIISIRLRKVKLVCRRKPNLGWYKLKIDGFKLDWRNGQKRSILEVDSIDIINILKSDVKYGEFNLIQKARDYLKKK